MSSVPFTWEKEGGVARSGHGNYESVREVTYGGGDGDRYDKVPSYLRASSEEQLDSRLQVLVASVVQRFHAGEAALLHGALLIDEVGQHGVVPVARRPAQRRKAAVVRLMDRGLLVLT